MRAFRQQREVFREVNARQRRGDVAERAAIRGRRVGLRIEALVVRKAALKVNHDDRARRRTGGLLRLLRAEELRHAFATSSYNLDAPASAPGAPAGSRRLLFPDHPCDRWFAAQYVAKEAANRFPSFCFQAL